MRIIAIDPGTRCGWAVLSPDGTFLSGAWNLAPRRHEGGGMRFLRMRRLFEELVTTQQYQLFPKGSEREAVVVAYEEVRRHLGTDAAHIYGGIVAIIQSVCEERAIPYKGIPVGTIKKHATGKGNADKTAMLAAAATRWPEHHFADDNEADARFIALTMKAELE